MKLLQDAPPGSAQQAKLRLIKDQKDHNDRHVHIGIHPARDYARLTKAERRLMREHRRGVAKKPVAGYVMLACLFALGWFMGRILWSLLSGL